MKQTKDKPSEETGEYIDVNALCRETKDEITAMIWEGDDELEAIAAAYVSAQRINKNATTDGEASAAVNLVNAAQHAMFQFMLDTAFACGFKIIPPHTQKEEMK